MPGFGRTYTKKKTSAKRKPVKNMTGKRQKNAKKKTK